VIPSSGTGTFDLGNLHHQLYLAKMGLGEAYVVKRKARTKTIARVKKAMNGSVEGAMTGWKGGKEECSAYLSACLTLNVPAWRTFVEAYACDIVDDGW